MQKFYTQSLLEITTILQEQLDSIHPKECLEFEVVNPDRVTSTYSGNLVTIENREYIYRGYKEWVDLAQILHCKMLTPTVLTRDTILLRFEKLNPDDSFHKSINDKEEKYGATSIFSEIHKMQEPSFMHYYAQSLKNVKVNKRRRVLNLGVNSGDEFEFIKSLSSEFSNLELVGIDYCESAISSAKKKFQDDTNISFYTHDINDLASLNLGKFDLIISIGTLQSSNLEFNPLLMSIVQNQLKRDGAMILGFPNCRFIDGEMIYGAKVKNYAFSEMGLLYKDVIFSKKYLQQKKYRVTITGKDYIFLTAVAILKQTNRWY